MLELWDDASKGSNGNSFGHGRRYAALDALRHGNDAIGTLHGIVSLLETHPDEGNHGEHRYGHIACGRLLEDIMARLGEARVLAWTGIPSSYNSCLPSAYAIHNQIPCSPLTIEDVEMEKRITVLKGLISPTDALSIHDRVTHLPPARFANHRLYLPCIVFQVKRLELVEQNDGDDEEKSYSAQASGIGRVVFRTSDSDDSFSSKKARKFVFVYPWIHELRDSLNESGVGSSSEGAESEYDSEWTDLGVEDDSAPAFSSEDVPVTMTFDYSQAFQLIVRMQQPFQALLLQKQSHGAFVRVAAEHEIIAPGLACETMSAKDIRVEISEIL